jgi:hypothetical protein
MLAASMSVWTLSWAGSAADGRRSGNESAPGRARVRARRPVPAAAACTSFGGVAAIEVSSGQRLRSQQADRRRAVSDRPTLQLARGLGGCAGESFGRPGAAAPGATGAPAWPT